LPDGAGGDELPEWLRIVPVGSFPNHKDGPHEVTDSDIEDMVTNFERRDTDLLVDFDHASVFDGDTRAAAWINEVEQRDDGLYGRIGEVTPAGQEAIANKDYRYISPVYFLEGEDKQGNDKGAWVHSVAITNLPYFDQGEVDPIGNSSPAPDDPDESDSGSDPSDINTTDPSSFMDRDTLIDLLGLDDDATDEEIEAALEEAAQAKEALDEADVPPDDEEDDPTDPSDDEPADTEADNEDEEGSEDEIEEKVNAIVDQRLEERDREGRAEALVDRAVEEGKISPAERDVYLNSACADFEATKEKIDQMRPGAALPRSTSVPSEDAGGPKTNRRRDLIEHLQAERAAA
jgi:phage I-like protein